MTLNPWELALLFGIVFVAFLVMIGYFQYQISCLLNENRRLRSLATTDKLTGVGNRRSLDERLGEEISRSTRTDSPLTFALIDIDEFKSINSAIGHAHADEILIFVARIISKELRRADHVFRYGGDEFGVVMPDTDSEESVIVFERIRARISRENPYRDQLDLSVSVGITSYPNEHFTPGPFQDYSIVISDIITQASEALLAHAKENHKIYIYNS